MKQVILAGLLLICSFVAHVQNVGIGTITPTTKLHVVGTTSNVATFSGSDFMFITLAEGINNRGYIGSYAGNPEDVDFGTYGGNALGKLHLTIQDVPKLTVAASGNIGIGTTTPLSLLHATNGSVLFDGTTGTTPVAGAGARMMWIPAKKAFRVGEVFGTQWDDAVIGNWSFAGGINNVALANGSTVFGINSAAYGDYSFIAGSGATTDGISSLALGTGTKAKYWSGTVVGHYNDSTVGSQTCCSDPLNRVFQIGIGTNNATRSNAMTVLENGKVGIGTTTPTELLDINGAIKVADATATPAKGTIRFNPANNDFEGFDGTIWKSLTASNNSNPPQPLINNDPNANTADNMGYSVKLYGEFAFVGVPNYKVGVNTNQGAVKIYQKGGTLNSYQLIQTLTATDGAAGDKFGFSLDASEFTGECTAAGVYGTTYLVVGAPNKSSNRGSVYLFRYDWLTNQFTTAVNNFFAGDGTANDNFGYAVSVLNITNSSYFRVLVGAPLKTVNGFAAQGRAYMLTTTGFFGSGCTSSFLTGFSEDRIFNMRINSANSYFGSAVAGILRTNGTETYAIGASFRNVGANANQGVVYMYKNNGLFTDYYDSIAVATDGNALDFFGNSISFDSHGTGMVAISAFNKEVGANAGQGQVYLFKDTISITGTSYWKQTYKFTAPDGAANDRFGSYLDWKGDYLLVGASNNDGTVPDAGAVYVYKTIPFSAYGLSYRKKITDASPQSNQMMGKAISHDGTKYLFGLPDWDSPAKIDAGRIIIGDIFY